PTTPEDEFRELLGEPSAAILAGGHTHQQFVRRCGASTFLNPGSVGFSLDHALAEEGTVRFDPWAAWAVVQVADELVSVEFRRAPLDRERVVAAIESSTMPEKGQIERWRA